MAHTNVGKPLTRTERTKIRGAVEALQNLLDWGNVYHTPIDEDTVYGYLEKTKRLLLDGR